MANLKASFWATTLLESGSRSSDGALLAGNREGAWWTDWEAPELSKRQAQIQIRDTIHPKAGVGFITSISNQILESGLALRTMGAQFGVLNLQAEHVSSMLHDRAVEYFQ
ncbi:MAG: hypothetical protein JO166_08720 [Deltaproteobacteria bacterium]|nr:hypothetical protein [Deltaproteobacteria bacterium]